MENPPVQDQQAAAETPGQTSAEPQAQVEPKHEGFQKRIDELTAARRQEERARRDVELMLAERDAQINELIAAVAAKQPDPVVEVDQEERKRFDSMMKPYLTKVEQMLGSLETRVSQQQLQSALQGEDQRVVDRAAEIAAHWQKNPNLRGLFTMEQAVTFARGEISKVDRQSAHSADAARKGFNQGSQVLTGQSLPPAIRESNGKLPQNFDYLTPDQQIAVLEKNGVHNSAF